jgi:transcription initiation factor TFIID subunit 12
MNLDDHRSRRKNTPGDQSMRRSIQDLVSSLDPNVRIDSEVEDVCLPLRFTELILMGGVSV